MQDQRFSDISFGMCWCLMSWVQQVHNAAVVARSLGCQCDTEMPTGRTLGRTASGPGTQLTGRLITSRHKHIPKLISLNRDTGIFSSNSSSNLITLGPYPGKSNYGIVGTVGTVGTAVCRSVM